MALKLQWLALILSGLAASAQTVPEFVVQPRSVSVSEGYGVILSCVASGSPPLSYAWTRNGQPISDGTNASFQIAKATLADGGAYTVRVSNPGGEIVSSNAILTVLEISPKYAWTTLAGTRRAMGSVDGAGAAARFSNPSGMFVDKSGMLYVADSASGQVRIVTPAGVVSTLRDSGGAPVLFGFPLDLARDDGGILYVLDNNGAIHKVMPNGGRVTISINRFNYGITLDSAGKLFLGDFGRGEVIGFNSDGTTSVVASGMGSILDLAFDSHGALYSADSARGAIWKYPPGGPATILAGTGGASPFGDGLGNNASFDHPNSVAVDSEGNIFVAEEFANVIRKISSAGLVTTIGGGTGDGPLPSGDGVGSDARFNNPRRVVVDAQGNLYVSDTGANTIRKGTPLTAATTSRPQLSVQFSGGQVTLTWPSSATGFLLESRDGLNPGANWQPVVGAAATTGENYVLTKSVSGSVQLYRLRKP